jgi:UDP-N-acetylglucosamine--N-acetylmuramyl-(pentapeptide) pyrophosphoryl-undecaprenol N-acetylglucosamine transferase
MKIERVILSGGGTGGHIFPAIAIANEIKKRNPQAAILFVGAEGKMEMEKVPAAGYEIIGLQIAGFQRRLTLSNFILPFKIIRSLLKARKILNAFKPQLVIGFGGYASGPTLQAAVHLGIPTLVQEQNSFPGKTNKILAKKVGAICTAYPGLDNYFPAEKIHLTGNPVRLDIVNPSEKTAAFTHFGLEPTKKTVLIIGGSLGARTLNQAMFQSLKTIQDSDIQLLWQCGKLYYASLNEQLDEETKQHVKLVPFIDRMDLAYSIADVIISRAGALSVSELCLVKKPIILVPSPNVAEDHQTKNAQALVEKNAAVLVRDNQAMEELIPTLLQVIQNPNRQEELATNIAHLGLPNATSAIVDCAEKLLEKSNNQ